MAELVPLGLRIESDEVEKGDKRLDSFATSAARAEKATDALAGGSRAADGAIAKMIASIEIGVRDLVAMGQAEMIVAQHAREAASATGSLSAATDKLAAEASGASGSLKQLDAHMDAYRSSLAATAAAANVANDNIGKIPAVHGRATASSKAMTQATLNLSRQFADVGVTAAMGMNPLMILIQQGPQIADAFQMAATQGLGFSAVMKGMWATFAPFLVALAPIIAGIAAVTAGFALFHRELSKQYPKNITDGLNLTDEQLKRVKTTTVSFGDTLAATFTVLGRRIMEGPIGEGLRWLGDTFNKVLDGIVTGFVYAAAGSNAAMGALYDTVVAHWKNFPAIMGDMAITTINHLIRAFNALPEKMAAIASMVVSFFAGAWEGIVAGANALPGQIIAAFSRAFRGAIDLARSAVGAIATSLVTLSVSALDSFRGAAEQAPAVGSAIADGVRRGMQGKPLIEAGPMIAELENPFAGAGQEAAETFVDSFQRRFAENRKILSDLAGDIGDEALARARRQALKEAGDANKEAAKAGDQRAQSLQRELDAMAATTDANYELARAYEKSGSAAAEAEAKAEAVGKATRRQGDIALFVAATLALNASKEAVSGAKKLRDIEDTLEATRRLNGMVLEGTLTSDQANAQLQIEASIRPLISAAAAEEGERKAYLLELAQKLTGQQEALNRANLEAQLLAANNSARDQIAMLERETTLLGASNLVRAVTLAQLAKEQELRAKGVVAGGPEWVAAIQAAKDLAAAQVQAGEAAENHNAALYEQLDALQAIEDRARDAGQGMAEAFGPVGKALGDLTSMVAGYATAQEAAAVRTAEAIKAAGDDQIAIDRITRQSGEESARARIDHYGDMLSASKGFFNEQSAAYKTLQMAEQVYRAFQFAMSVKSIVMGSAETAASVAQSGTKGAASMAAGAAKMFEFLGPFAFPVVGAMVALLAGLGMRGAGGGGGASVPTLPQTNTGTGTVLGDPNDQSDSLAKSLEMSERYWNKDLDYSNKMVSALRAIQANIGSLTTAIAKEMNIGGGLDPSGLNKGPTTSGGLFGIGATTRSASVVGSGINLQGGNLAALIAGGVSGALYQIVQNTKTKSGFLGIGGKTTTWNSEETTGIDGQVSREISRVLASLRDGVLTAAGKLGVEGASATLDAFQVNLGRISFDGLSSSEINEKLNAVFSAVGDDMARAILPGLDAFQKAGEGLFETLARLVTEYQAVDDVMASLGKTFGPVGLGSIEARARLVELAGGLEAFTDSAAFFAENFLTEAQRMEPIQKAVTAELTRLGLATDISRAQFADLVRGLDVSTEGGAAMYAALMNLAPALAKVLDYTEETTGVIGNATDLARQRRELELRLLEAQGRISEALAGRRADELAAMDASLRPMQEAIWAAQDMATAAEQLAKSEADAAALMGQLARQRRSMEIELLDAQGKASEAVAARRQDELDALDATLRPLQLAIWAAQDLAAASAVLAQAAAEAAAAAEEAARAEAALATQRRGPEIQLMEALGDASGALAARRADELAALDPTLRALQSQIWAAQDLAAASQEAADAQQQAADAARGIALQRRQLEIELMRATGNEAGALAATRADEVAALDESLRAIQLAIYAAQDLAAANEAAAQAAQAAQAAAEAAEQAYQQRVETARSNLSQAYEREAGTLQGIIDKFGSFGDSLRSFRDTLGQADDSTASYASRRADFLRTANLARLGDEAALGSLQGVSQDFLSSSLDNASSNVAYQRDIAAVRAAVDAAIGTADRGKTNAERQLEALKNSVSGLIEVNESVLSVRDAIRDLMLVMGGRAPIGPSAPSAPTAAYQPDFTPAPLSTTLAEQIGLADPVDLVAEIRSLGQQVAALRAEQTAGHTAIAQNTGQTARTLDRWDGDGLPEERDAA